MHNGVSQVKKQVEILVRLPALVERLTGEYPFRHQVLGLYRCTSYLKLLHDTGPRRNCLGALRFCSLELWSQFQSLIHETFQRSRRQDDTRQRILLAWFAVANGSWYAKHRRFSLFKECRT